MALITVNGIVTRYANYRDNDRILTLFTRERGLISAAARGCRRPKSPLLPASELFVSGEFVLFFNRENIPYSPAMCRKRFIRCGRMWSVLLRALICLLWQTVAPLRSNPMKRFFRFCFMRLALQRIRIARRLISRFALRCAA